MDVVVVRAQVFEDRREPSVWRPPTELVPLVGGDYQNSFLRSDNLRRGSVTITPNTVAISYSRCVEISQPRMATAYDTNVKSLVGFASDGRVERHDLSVIARIRTEGAERRARFNATHSNDRRVVGRVCRRIGKRERERVKRMLHEVSKAVVQSAKKEGGAIILERLTHILSPRNGRERGRTTRVMLHRWSFGELHRQIKYKAAWDGVPVECVNPCNTSKKCSQCGRLNRALRNERTWRCPSCGATHDRDVNAAKNVLALSKLGCQLLVPAGALGR
ncbi:MAG: RNA-guided endonuclease TnpB family protein [Nitrososphaerales archaeon]|nr:RNA-guided endonuclease TnpB family protein [Nitrososphaerales archaeon]